MYLFHLEPWGHCQIDTSTSGKHGFGLPKLFKVTSRDGNFAGTFTVRFKNRDVMELQTGEQNNAALIRVAITQFCQWNGNRDHDSEHELDSSLQAYKGEVSNRHGRILSETSLLPRDRVRERGRNDCQG